jgi:hypothetical protein
MFAGGDYEEVGRWLRNFMMSHAKREDPRLEVVIETEGARQGKSYGVRLRLGEAVVPPAGQKPIELSHEEVASGRGSLAWCSALAARVRSLARELVSMAPGPAQSALAR